MTSHGQQTNIDQGGRGGRRFCQASQLFWPRLSERGLKKFNLTNKFGSISHSNDPQWSLSHKATVLPPFMRVCVSVCPSTFSVSNSNMHYCWDISFQILPIFMNIDTLNMCSFYSSAFQRIWFSFVFFIKSALYGWWMQPFFNEIDDLTWSFYWFSDTIFVVDSAWLGYSCGAGLKTRTHWKRPSFLHWGSLEGSPGMNNREGTEAIYRAISGKTTQTAP